MMQLDPRLSKTAIFAADRRADVTVTLNAPITEALGQEAQSFSDSLKRSTAAALAPYPDLSFEFSAGRLMAVSPEVFRQFVISSDIGPNLAMHLFDIMQDAAAIYMPLMRLSFYQQVSLTSLTMVRINRVKSVR